MLNWVLVCCPYCAIGLLFDYIMRVGLLVVLWLRNRAALAARGTPLQTRTHASPTCCRTLWPISPAGAQSAPRLAMVPLSTITERPPAWGHALPMKPDRRGFCQRPCERTAGAHLLQGIQVLLECMCHACTLQFGAGVEADADSESQRQLQSLL